MTNFLSSIFLCIGETLNFGVFGFINLKSFTNKLQNYFGCFASVSVLPHLKVFFISVHQITLNHHFYCITSAFIPSHLPLPLLSSLVVTSSIAFFSFSVFFLAFCWFILICLGSTSPVLIFVVSYFKVTLKMSNICLK